ncbi:2-oxoglutarate dehydrogenase complex dihydrolipoyllysine-residue succinyltransferase [Sphingomonas astaxanthinifaciens]|uniref:Dihydrolipoyllysine-residue succinyltransferase component of 2-oxoglutarate dehydrogenase complex n=1 Tax=Sphingomonas astaxanthinifaciens DSM 22298 TaxID=1123267 RepID=A0ABQ5Z9E7_9SPHN|nr:2-oxoglutarate dehydrogenase complex dihydrolipoyllysine-residue succinyltransferase [Sphingomonas astaxanthinifaciens]GLR47493.1 dihydrolipoyllysine-residue succinyltransferase component of 2-oxoglutarate dehydrogenase complex [Sphingomonas astaxanthinifaciens DSM 22298]
MGIEVKVPALGESITEATLGAWLKKPGDAVAVDEPVASLETDKVSVDVPSPVAGVFGEALVAEGDTVNVGAVIATIGEGSGAAAAPATKPAEPAAAPAPAAASTSGHEITDEQAQALRLSPSVRRAVQESGIDAASLTGTGKDGRITKEDVAKASSAPAPAAAAPAPAKASVPASPKGERSEERVKMTRLRQTIATRLKDAQNTAALLTTFNDVDMTEVIAARARYKDLFEKKHGIRLGFMGFFTKAAALAARDVPSVNARIEGDEIVYHNYLDVSVAVSAPKGLVVPVVRSADQMSFAEIERTIADFGARAKAGTLTADDMKGGTFTISNGGVFGSLMSTPIINPPQSAVLGLHRIEERPVVKDGQIVARPMMYLALSYDHRLVDGREAVTFLVRIKEAIEDPTRLLIDL